MFLKTFNFFNQSQDRIRIETKWLEIDDYPLMVASADLGICMHLSSSNLDLPMKVVDMFSCQLPCFAYEYPTISELVTPEVGRLFKTEEELCQLLVDHLKDGKGIERFKGYSD